MRNNPFLKRTVIMSVVIVTVWLFWPSVPQQTAVVKTPLKTPINKKVVEQVKPIKKIVETAIKLAKITSNDSAILVAKAYAAELNSPPYSQPLSNNDFDRLKPNHFNPQSIPVDDNGATITAELSKYRYIYPEPILATLSGKNIDHAELVLVDISSGKSLLTAKFVPNDSIWTVQLEGKRNFPTQLQATVKAKINEKNISIALSLKYADSVATLEDLAPPTSSDTDMVLRANLTTREQGLYRVRANLFDANNQPIAHLVGKEKLRKGHVSLELKAHHSVLQGRKLPFYLSTFSIELMSPAPGKPTKYGDSAIVRYDIKDFAISSLSDIPYKPSAQEQQRLLLLQKMAQGK
jgi:hypothetical protein